MAYLQPQYFKKLDGGKYLSCETKISTDSPLIEKALENAVSCCCPDGETYKSVSFVRDVPCDIRKKVSEEFAVEFKDDDEAYVIDIQDDIMVYSLTEKGLFYGCMTLLQMMEDQYIERMFAYDYPVCSVRGVKVYLPGRGNIPYFKEFVDMITYYKYNTIMIEVGGAMEYKRRPEINEKWVEYCKEMSEYSGKTIDIQERTFKWYKNSIHVENGEGSYLTQEEVRDLVNYCKERHLNVIAEVPSLSHCDYLLLPYPELRERQDDPYPDTYCPSNPKSYEVLFDVLDEVIDVFQPEIINIGHDEYYSIAICDKCKGKKAEEIFANDIKKIMEYLSARGIKTMIWGEKLLNAYDSKGRPQGGAEKKMYMGWDYENGEFLGIMPATYKAIDLVPRDLKILHWYWGVDEKLEEDFHARGFEVTYGNFAGSQFRNWKKRISRGVKGGIISNWSTLKEENLQRNGMLFEVMYAARMFWDNDYDDHMHDQVRDEALKELYRYKHKAALERAMSSNVAEDGCEYIKVLHTTDRRIEYKLFYDGVFIEHDKYALGEYVVEYEDGSSAELPIVYGGNISNKDVSWEKRDNLIIEVASSTLPLRVGDVTYYETIYRNPHPEKKIRGISVKKSKDEGYNIFVKAVELI